MGSARVRETLPPLLRAVREAGHPVVWSCDPMHANGIRTAAGGTHENGLRSAIGKAVRNYMETHEVKVKGVSISAEDIREGVVGILSIFLREPQ